MAGSNGWQRWWRSARDAVRAQRTSDPGRSGIAYGLSAAYPEALKLERTFHDKERLWRFTPDSDRFAPLAMLPVRYVWPARQRSANFASTSPAQDFELRAGHDEAMYEWARHCTKEPVVLTTGHTHKPAFRRRDPSGALPGAVLPSGQARPTEAEARARLTEIRLVRWLNNTEEPKPHVLDRAPLRQVLDEVRGQSGPG